MGRYFRVSRHVDRCMGRSYAAPLPVCRWVAPFPPIVANAAIVPFVLRYAYGMDDTLPFMIFTVSVGEIATCGVLGVLLYGFLARHAGKIGLNEEKDAAPGAANNEKI